MKKLLSTILVLFLLLPQTLFAELTDLQKSVFHLGINNKCQNIKATDIPTIFIPGIVASWYSEFGYNETKVKRWIPDPITHVYDSFFYTFKKEGNYTLRDVFYKGEFETEINGNPKNSLYLFGYDWKKDNKITAKILGDLVMKIRVKYKIENGCDIGTVNIIGHSMGGLVARTMLEDMCASEQDIDNYYKNIELGKIKNITSNKCNYTKINKLITIATPHMGAPSSLPVWEKGNLERTSEVLQALGISNQLGKFSDEGLYDIIHGQDNKVPNGIVTLGQLLPDINTNTNYIDNLLYLEKNGTTIPKTSYPQNSFLNELNKKENIEKMFSDVNKFSLYYSNTTGDIKSFGSVKNNIIGYEIFSGDFQDKTEEYIGKDIYDKYLDYPSTSIYRIKRNIIDSIGNGGDGTVPTLNLLLKANDGNLDYSKLTNNGKYKQEKISCLDENLQENTISKKMGKDYLELCSHTRMPTMSSIRVLEEITGKDIRNSDSNKTSLIKERDEIYKHLGYVDYTYEEKYIRPSTTGYKEDTIYHGIKNSQFLNELFENDYNYFFKLKKEGEKKSESEKFIDERKTEEYKDKRKKLTYGNKLGGLIRYEILSPINVIIEDEQGRKIGIDPETGLIINEIPGAWTSGNTEGSGQAEFFLIPVGEEKKVNHNIKTYGTGDGEYHITVQEIQQDQNGINTSSGELVVIEGVAKKDIGENYKIEKKEDEIIEYIITESNIDRTKELEKQTEEKIEENEDQENNEEVKKEEKTEENTEKAESKEKEEKTEEVVEKIVENKNTIQTVKRSSGGGHSKKYKLRKAKLKAEKELKRKKEYRIKTRNTLEKNYKPKIEKICKILKRKYSKKNLNKIKVMLKNKKQYFLNKQKNEYYRIKMEYLIDKLLEIL